jgi:hypothetical protein
MASTFFYVQKEFIVEYLDIHNKIVRTSTNRTSKKYCNNNHLTINELTKLFAFHKIFFQHGKWINEDCPDKEFLTSSSICPKLQKLIKIMETSDVYTE